MEVQKPRKLNWQWVLIPDSAKSTVCFFFPLTAQLPNQDESCDDQTHLVTTRHILVPHRHKFCVLLYTV
jgi:hypothetical protein